MIVGGDVVESLTYSGGILLPGHLVELAQGLTNVIAVFQTPFQNDE